MDNTVSSEQASPTVRWKDLEGASSQEERISLLFQFEMSSEAAGDGLSDAQRSCSDPDDAPDAWVTASTQASFHVHPNHSK